MKRKDTLILVGIIFLIVVWIINLNSESLTYSPIITNQKVIENLYQEINMSNPYEVFEYVFTNLPDEIFIYPTENYYYFEMYLDGRKIKGSMSFFAEKQEERIIDFGYIEQKDETNIFNFERNTGGNASFSENEGLFVKKINDFKYKVNYKGKTIIFNLNKLNLAPPKNTNLTKEEIFIGPVFDESALQFDLIFNQEIPHFYFILNEDVKVPEYFEEISENKELLEGQRTGFIFYNDLQNNRKILIGVKGQNVLKNNWYDGPFDQLPDNYIKTGEIKIQPYIEAAYPGSKGKIDYFGHYLDNPQTRIAIAPYTIYFSNQDLEFVRVCKEQSKSKSEFYVCITQQVYQIPSDFYT